MIVDESGKKCSKNLPPSFARAVRRVPAHSGGRAQSRRSCATSKWFATPTPPGAQRTKSAIKMTIGIGTPSSRRRMERIGKPPLKTLLDNYYVVPLAAAEGRGQACRKGTYQESNEDP